MRSRHHCVAVLFAILAAVPAAAESPPPSVPPLGWEERVTPGYEPGVESVIVRMGRGELLKEEDVHAVWSKWNEEAVDVLTNLLGDEQWKGFHVYALRLLALSPHDRAANWMQDTLRTLAKKDETTPAEANLLNSLLYASPRRDPALEQEFIEFCLREGSSRARQWAVGRLIGQRTEASLARAAEAYEAMPDRESNAWIPGSIKEAQGYLRAQEPMDAPQEKEDAQ